MSKLVDALNARGWTQKELSQRTGIRQYTLCKYASGKNTPSVLVAIRIADALGVEDIRELFSDSGNL